VKDGKLTAWGILILIAVILLFVGVSLGLGFNVAWLTGVCTGLLTTIISALVTADELKKPKRRLIAPVTALAAGAIITCCSGMMYFDPQIMDKIYAMHDHLVGRVIMTVIGMLLIILPLSERSRRRLACSEQVQATCISREQTSYGKHQAYHCEYEYWYGGERHTITVTDHALFNFRSKHQPGRENTLWIDPEYFDEYYIPFDRNDLSWTIMLVGTLLVISAVFFGSSM
jgi:hypothetical protein